MKPFQWTFLYPKILLSVWHKAALVLTAASAQTISDRVRQVSRYKGLRKKGFKSRIDRSILSDTAMMLEVKSCWVQATPTEEALGDKSCSQQLSGGLLPLGPAMQTLISVALLPASHTLQLKGIWSPSFNKRGQKRKTVNEHVSSTYPEALKRDVVHHIHSNDPKCNPLHPQLQNL